MKLFTHSRGWFASLIPVCFSATIMVLLAASSQIVAQDQRTLIQQYLDQHLDTYNLTFSDVNGWTITSQQTSKQSGVTYVYIRQQYRDIPVANGVANFAIRDGKVITMGNNLVGHLDQKIHYASPSVNPIGAVEAAVRHLGLNTPRDLKVIEPVSPTSFICSAAGISREEIPVQLMYHVLPSKAVKLVWDVTIYPVDEDHWWSIRMDAQSGEVVAQNDMIVHCSFESSPFAHQTHAQQLQTAGPVWTPAIAGSPDQYTVLPIPAESPNHGVRATVVNPADLIASPFGWHDTDGIQGPEFTITRGNNVYAYEDADNDDVPGFSPDGGPSLDFNFPYNQADNPATFQPAAITNLFYMNNVMHDVWYQYGFDETSGNFQANNYQVGGDADDYVLAEAQDGGGLNNANFGTPPDGSNPRMQMYLWNNTVPGNFLTVNTPATIAGGYLASAGSFGPALPSIPLTGDLVQVDDDTDPIHDGCSAFVNAAQLPGKIAVIDRGDCTFVEKVQAAQDAGAIAVIIINNIPGDPIQMGGASGTILIPAIMISQADGALILAEMATGTVNASISDGGGAVTSVLDGDFDNGIIAHEYGHGISTRLVGGPMDVSCLFNSEQMGEGWSDWFGLMLTIEPGDKGTDVRGIGTFAIAQSTLGTGIRPAPYSTDLSINGYTYAASNDAVAISEPHGVGFIFATMLWDLNWALIDYYGGTPDPDVYTGTGGNNVAMKLVIEGLKLTPCNPGMVDGRDAILMADQVLYGGEHECLIWEVFARRGLGYSANQGASTSRTDQTEAFDLPPTCLTATEPPVAAFNVDTLLECTKTVVFADSSTSIPQHWLWDFGDGTTSEERNPVHTYRFGGTYFVKLVVTNTIGSDSTLQAIHIILPPTPETEDVVVCGGDAATVITTVTGQAIWKDITNTVVHIGDTLSIPSVEAEQTFYIENQVGEPSALVGPVDGNFGTGSYHGSGYFGAINFTAESEFTIVSAWVDAQSDGERTFVLGRGSNFDGQIPGGANFVQSVTVFVPAGQHRIDLGLKVPEAGDYCVGAALNQGVMLYRNNSGASYPYALPGYMTMTSSSANTNPPAFYYYLYDLEVRRGDLCISDPDTVKVSPVISHFNYVEEVGGILTFTDASTGATSWHWDFGDGETSDEQHPIHTYIEGGDYVITLTINDGLCSSTQTYTFITTGTSQGIKPLSLALQPNPTSESTTLRLADVVTEDLEVHLEDFNGKTLATYKILSGQKEIRMDVSGLPTAVYVIQVKGSHYAEVRKLVVGH